ncbi:MAG: hypothetical protein QW112_00770, partial [Candidatus Micrarchaeia archaeon]
QGVLRFFIIIITFINIIFIIKNMPKVSISISIDTSLLYEIEELSKKEGKTRTQKLVEIISDYLKKKK